MKTGKNKLRKINTFDLLDTENLEKYLSEMALEGWMINKISTMFLVFEKTKPQVVKFFVDITDKKLMGDNYNATNDYIEQAKEDNLEHICGNENFQIFINRGSKRQVDRSKLKLSKILSQDLGIIINIIIATLPFTLNNSMYGESLQRFFSSNIMILWLTVLVMILLLNLLIIITKFIKYRKIKKVDSHSFKEINNSKLYTRLNKYSAFSSIIFVGISVLFLLNINMGSESNISSEKLPLSLEDFNVPLGDRRDCSNESYSSYISTYDSYNDYTYTEIKEEIISENEEDYLESYLEEDSKYLTYSVFESKYDEVINRVLLSILKVYDEYNDSYKLLDSEEELKYWGANKVYKGDFIYDRVVVYDNKIITISGDIKYNKKNINLIKININ